MAVAEWMEGSDDDVGIADCRGVDGLPTSPFARLAEGGRIPDGVVRPVAILRLVVLECAVDVEQQASAQRLRPTSSTCEYRRGRLA